MHSHRNLKIHLAPMRRIIGFMLVLVMASGGAWQVLLAQRELPRIESRFTFARIRFKYPFSFRWRGSIGDPNGPPWSHDFPRSEENLMKILSETTRIDVNPGGHIVTFDSDEVFQYPIAYLCEVGYLTLTDHEIANMREYLLRGGFLIVDDFRGPREFDNFQEVMKQVFPERSLELLPGSHPIFTGFYDVSGLDLQPPYARFNGPQYWGMKDDDGRLMMVVDYNNDISEYWEWSAEPFFRLEDTNEGFKFGVNYVLYALTH